MDYRIAITDGLELLEQQPIKGLATEQHNMEIIEIIKRVQRMMPRKYF